MPGWALVPADTIAELIDTTTRVSEVQTTDSATGCAPLSRFLTLAYQPVAAACGPSGCEKSDASTKLGADVVIRIAAESAMTPPESAIKPLGQETEMSVHPSAEDGGALTRLITMVVSVN